MTAKLAYRWHLRRVLATRGIFSTAALRPLLAARGIHLSASQVYRLVAETPERLSLKVLVALLDILDCQMADLIEPVTAPTTAKPQALAGGGGVGTFRPKPARIVPPERP
jgi:DNA-binding Xre family transcriptional regulator